MAFNLLSARQSGWGRGSDETNVARLAVLGGLVVLIVGVGIGVLVTSLLSGGKPAAANTPVISPNIDDMKLAPKTPDGAVQAVTSYVAGFPSASLRSSDQQARILNEILAPTAEASLKSDLARGLVNARDKLIGANAGNSTLTTRLIVSPASYKVDMLTPERARVQVWAQNVLVESSSQQATSSWVTQDVQVQWSDHWRIVSISTTNGPTPRTLSPGGQVSEFPDVLRVINGFKAFRSATAPAS